MQVTIADAENEVLNNTMQNSGTSSDEPPPGFLVPLFKNNITVGAVHLPDVADLVIQAKIAGSKEIVGVEGIALWQKHFAPTEATDNTIQVSEEWADFITLALLTPDNFEWAKALLSSQLWHYILEGANKSQCRPFLMPVTCLSQHAPNCKMQEMEQVASSVTAFSTPQSKPAVAPKPILPSTTTTVYVSKKRKEKAHLVDTEVRRSDRLQLLNNGFKKQTCQTKNCFPYNTVPPNITPKVVKNLSVSFCKAAAQDCSEEMLQQPKKKKQGKDGNASTTGLQKKKVGAKP